jgi:AcrR family transcriptional regulator
MADDALILVQGDASGGGKREETKRANRQAILDAARGVFGEMGYEGVSVRDIIRRTPLSVGAFYNYYRSKEEVYEALAADGARRFKPILRAEYEKATDFDSFLRAAITAYFRFSLAEHEAWQVMRPEGERSHPHVRVEGPEQKAVFEEVRAVISDGIERGLAPRVDADYLAAAAIGVAREVCERMIERRPHIDLEAAVEFAHQMIQGGVAALPSVGD